MTEAQTESDDEDRVARILAEAILGSQKVLGSARGWSVVSERQIKAMALIIAMMAETSDASR